MCQGLQHFSVKYGIRRFKVIKCLTVCGSEIFYELLHIPGFFLLIVIVKRKKKIKQVSGEYVTAEADAVAVIVVVLGAVHSRRVRVALDA